jgi:hypothetical protein
LQRPHARNDRRSFAVPAIRQLRLRIIVVVAGLAALAALLALPALRAHAVDAAAPTPCGGTPLLTDPAGDQVYDPSGLNRTSGPGTKKTPDNTDLRSVFFNYRADKDGNPVLTANLQVANLTTTLPSSSDSQGGIYYYAHWSFGGQSVFVKAVNAPSGISYSYGHLDDSSMAFITYSTDGPTKGAFFEGPNGIVQIDVPKALGGELGKKLGGALGVVDYIQGADDNGGVNVHVDVAPGTAASVTPQTPNGKTYTVVDCATAALTPPAAGGGAGGGPAGGASKLKALLPFKASIVIGSARKANRKRTLRFKVRATKKITGLRVQLKRASGKGKVLATGTLKSIKGIATLKMKLAKGAKLKKKTKYALVATGTVDGERLSAGQRVKVKK